MPDGRGTAPTAMASTVQLECPKKFQNIATQ